MYISGNRYTLGAMPTDADYLRAALDLFRGGNLPVIGQGADTWDTAQRALIFLMQSLPIGSVTFYQDLQQLQHAVATAGSAYDAVLAMGFSPTQAAFVEYAVEETAFAQSTKQGRSAGDAHAAAAARNLDLYQKAAASDIPAKVAAAYNAFVEQMMPGGKLPPNTSTQTVATAALEIAFNAAYALLLNFPANSGFDHDAQATAVGYQLAAEVPAYVAIMGPPRALTLFPPIPSTPRLAPAQTPAPAPGVIEPSRTVAPPPIVVLPVGSPSAPATLYAPVPTIMPPTEKTPDIPLQRIVMYQSPPAIDLVPPSPTPQPAPSSGTGTPQPAPSSGTGDLVGVVAIAVGLGALAMMRKRR